MHPLPRGRLAVLSARVYFSGRVHRCRAGPQ